MALVLADIKERVRVEGKDAIDRFADLHEDFIKETCLEISKSKDFHHFEETVTKTVPSPKTDWFDLDTNFYNTIQVGFLNSDGNMKFLEYVSESDYFFKNYQLSSDVLGFYRLRYTSNKWQMCLINGPDAGSTLYILQKTITDDVTKFPDNMKEAIIKGATSRFLKFQEGDDLEMAMTLQEDYFRLLNQDDHFGDKRVSRQPRRTKTLNELYSGATANRYGN